jgi:hypothetical protein
VLQRAAVPPQCLYFGPLRNPFHIFRFVLNTCFVLGPSHVAVLRCAWNLHNVVQGKTSSPDYLTESDLIGLMEQHGIGTDASIAVHVHNVCERIEAGRRVVPTELGVTLISGYQRIDPELCRPQVLFSPPRQCVFFSSALSSGVSLQHCCNLDSSETSAVGSAWKASLMLGQYQVTVQLLCR